MARHRAKHSRSTPPRRSVPRWVWLALACVAVVGVVAWSLGRAGAGRFTPASRPEARAAAQPAVAVESSAATEATATPIEVPTLVGLQLDEARLVLKAAGLSLIVRREAQTRSSEPTISAQDPAPGALAQPGSQVTLVLPTDSKDKGGGDSGSVKRGEFVVCIDPGHQSHTDSKTEPVGPGSTVFKPRITGGTTGIVTGAPECETVLQIATNLKARLEAAGVRVVMTRSTNDENLSNVERAQMANAAKANLFLRLHADSNTDEKLSGVSTLYPAEIPWTKDIAGSSRSAAGIMQAAVVKATRAVDVGTAERSDLAGFNWSKVPCVSVSVGFPSNPVEDRLLVSPKYQDQIAQGLAQGTIEYLERAQ